MSGMDALTLGLFSLWLIFCFWSHEFGHFLAIKVLGYKSIALIVLVGIVAWGVVGESIRNKRDKMIVAAAGPSVGFFASVALALVVIASGAWPSVLIWPALLMPLSISIFDFTYLWMAPRYPIGELKRRSIRLIMGFSPPSRWSVAVIFSKDMWPTWKKKQEQMLGKKLDFKEVVITN